MFLLVSEGIIAKFLDADFASVSGVVKMSKRVLFFWVRVGRGTDISVLGCLGPFRATM